jgi:DNA repair protein RecN (Recombination protein N)
MRVVLVATRDSLSHPMLRRLSIRDIVLIDRLDLEFESGLSVLTGETGAGKSILLDSLGLALGARAEPNLVRKGEAGATVVAEFALAPDHPALLAARDHGVSVDGDLILRRTLSSEGRSRAWVNDEPASIGLLRALGVALVEIHGQFDTHGLLDPATHRAALDAFGGLAERAKLVASLHDSWRQAAAAEHGAAEAAASAARDQEFLAHAVQEFDALAVQDGEAETLAQRRAILAQSGKLIEALNAALADLNAGKGAEGALRTAARHLERVAAQAGGTFAKAIDALDRAATMAADAVAEVEAAGTGIDLDPSALERLEDRLFAIRALARKHRVEPDALPGLAAEFQQRMALAGDSEAMLRRLAAETAAALRVYREAAETLSQARADAARKLDRAIMRELPPLKLDKARFRTRIERLGESEWNAGGIDRVAFEVATIPGAEPGAIGKIASGGELARFMLALRVVLAKTGVAATLVFDEVDSGIGGAVADAVGERLARLARDVQVLVVTHSPQVAARGQSHWRVVKRGTGAALATRVEALDERARREEIARMLSGAAVTDAARAAAASLLAGAHS